MLSSVINKGIRARFLLISIDEIARIIVAIKIKYFIARANCSIMCGIHCDLQQVDVYVH